MSPDWAEILKENPITLMEEKRVITENELRKNYSGKIAVLDFYIEDIEKRVGGMEIFYAWMIF